MTISTLFPIWYAGRDVLDPRRIRTSWKQFKGLHGLTPARFTAEAVCRERDRLLKRYSPSTVRRSLADIGVFGRWLAAEGHIKECPIWKAPPESKPRQRWLSQAEMKLLMETSRRQDVPLWFDQALHLSLLTGQRIAAILDLQWTQIENGIVDFNRGVSKRCKRRGVVPVTTEIGLILAECRNDTPYVLARVGYDGFLKEWRRVCELAGIDGATPHSMRHSVATNLIAGGVALIEVSRLLGHSSVAITEKVYAKFAPDYTRNASEAMGRILR